MIKSLFAALFLSFLSVSALANDPDRQNSVWVTSGFATHHFRDSYDQPYFYYDYKGNRHEYTEEVQYNNDNDGIGLEYHFNESWKVGGGVYKNSYYEDSEYLSLNWSKPVGYASLGLSLAAITGYDVIGKPLVVTVLPTLSVEYKRVGVNILVSPYDSAASTGFISAQFKFKVW